MKDRLVRAPRCSKMDVPLANWTNRERKEGWDKKTRIITKRKRSSSRERELTWTGNLLW